MEEKERLFLGKQLRIKRLNKELTLEDVAQKLGTSKQNISRYEKGNYIKPDHELLNKIKEFLGVEEITTSSNGSGIESTLRQKISELEAKNSEINAKYIAALEKLGGLK